MPVLVFNEKVVSCPNIMIRIDALDGFVVFLTVENSH